MTPPYEVTGERCPVTELFVEQCACRRCRPATPADPFAEPSNYGPWFVASYWGSCSDCGERFAEGDHIRADGAGGYLCQMCGQT